jgi:hypothetical protein
MAAYRSGARSELPYTTVLESPSKGEATVLDRNRRELRLGISTSPIFDKDTGSTVGVAWLLHRLDGER